MKNSGAHTSRYVCTVNGHGSTPDVASPGWHLQDGRDHRAPAALLSNPTECAPARMGRTTTSQGVHLQDGQDHLAPAALLVTPQSLHLQDGQDRASNLTGCAPAGWAGPSRARRARRRPRRRAATPTRARRPRGRSSRAPRRCPGPPAQPRAHMSSPLPFSPLVIAKGFGQAFTKGEGEEVELDGISQEGR